MNKLLKEIFRMFPFAGLALHHIELYKMGLCRKLWDPGAKAFTGRQVVLREGVEL